jgi:hypothetical protein
MVGCSNDELISGTEKTYYGIVTDRGMSVIYEGDRKGRPYISIICDDSTSACFWYDEDLIEDVQIGDYVKIESAVDGRKNVLIAISIETLG